MDVDDSLASWGPQLLRFSQVRELAVRWYSGAATTIDTLFPPELARLRTLRRVTLLNVPLADFPAWLIDLPNLQYLTVRGTDVTCIPDWICSLKQLRTLRVENCRLTTLPTTLRQMAALRELGLSDTQIHDFSPAQFPPNLKRLSFHGSGRYVRRDVAKLQQALKGTKIFPDLSHPTWPPESR
ncbi:MAG: leucine-rich repeat domain-containing protein [Janthinobacterium lividum]